MAHLLSCRLLDEACTADDMATVTVRAKACARKWEKIVWRTRKKKKKQSLSLTSSSTPRSYTTERQHIMSKLLNLTSNMLIQNYVKRGACYVLIWWVSRCLYYVIAGNTHELNNCLFRQVARFPCLAYAAAPAMILICICLSWFTSLRLYVAPGIHIRPYFLPEHCIRWLGSCIQPSPLSL